MIEQAGVRFNNGDYYFLEVDPDVPTYEVIGTINGEPVDFKSPYTLKYTDEVEVNTTSTTEIDVKTLDFTIEASKVYLIEITDEEGTRNNCFYETRSLIPTNSSKGNVRCGYTGTISPDGILEFHIMGTTIFGVYPAIDADYAVKIMARYSSANSRTINSKYDIKIYEVELPE